MRTYFERNRNLYTPSSRYVYRENSNYINKFSCSTVSEDSYRLTNTIRDKYNCIEKDFSIRINDINTFEEDDFANQ